MKRIGFMIQSGDDGWLGGISYRRNLLHAIVSNAERQIEPVLFTHPSSGRDQLSGFPHVEQIDSSLASGRHLARRVGQICQRMIGRDLALEALMRQHHIDALSHSAPVGSRSQLVSMVWIADFQHLRMPQFFSASECRRRNVVYRRMIEQSARVILSSADAARDFMAFAPESRGKARVLHFVSGFDNACDPVEESELRARFAIDGPYFHLPNQFWKHKNHGLVVEALGILKRRGVDALVVATGKAFDYRHPRHVESLLDRARQLGVQNQFRILGVVTLPELRSLMTNAMALINPSDFEGWSTSVEESKSLGLPIILSDIPVHMEQAPPLGMYFSAGSAEELAEAMSSTMERHDPDVAVSNRAVASENLAERVISFGRAYESIVLDALTSPC